MTKDKYNSSTAVYETSAQVEFSGDIASPESTPAGPLSPLFQGTTLRYTGSVKLRMYEELSLIYEDGELYYEDAGSSIYGYEVTVPAYEPEVLCAAYGGFPGQCTFFAHTSPVPACAYKHAKHPHLPSSPVDVFGLVASVAITHAAAPEYAVAVSVSAAYSPSLERSYPGYVLDAYGHNLNFYAESASLTKAGVGVELTWGSGEKVVVGSIRHIAGPVQVAYRRGTLYRLSMYRSNPELRYPGDSLIDFGYIHELTSPALAVLSKDSRPLKLRPVIVGEVTAATEEPLLGLYSKALVASTLPIELVELSPFISADSVAAVVVDYFDCADAGHVPAPVCGTFEVACLTAESHLFDASQRWHWPSVFAGHLDYTEGAPLISSLLCDTFAFDVHGESVDISLRGLLELQAVRAEIDATKAYTHMPAHEYEVLEVASLVSTPGSTYSISTFTGIYCHVECTFTDCSAWDAVDATYVYCVDDCEYVGLYSPEQFLAGHGVLVISEYVSTHLGEAAFGQTALQVAINDAEFSLESNITVGTPVQAVVDFFSTTLWDTANTVFVADTYFYLVGWALEPNLPHLPAHPSVYTEYVHEPVPLNIAKMSAFEVSDIKLAYDGDAFGMTVLSAYPPQYTEYTPGDTLVPHDRVETCYEPFVSVSVFDWVQECTFSGAQLRVGNTDPFINGYIIPRTPALLASYAANMGDTATLYRYGIPYRGIDLLYRVGSGMREWMTGGLAYAVEVRVADLQCTLGIANKALIVRAEFHDILQDQHKRSGLGDEGSKGRRSVMYRTELVGSGLLYRGAGPVYVSDIVFDQDKMHTAFLTFECQTPWDIYELNAVEYSAAEWLVPPLYSQEAIGYEVCVSLMAVSEDSAYFNTEVHIVAAYACRVDVTPGNMEGIRAPHDVVGLNLPISLEPAATLGAFNVAAEIVSRQSPEWEHALLPSEVTCEFPDVSMQGAITLNATVYFPEYTAYRFTDGDITRTVHDVCVSHPTYSISQSFEFWADISYFDSVYAHLLVPISTCDVYTPDVLTAFLTGIMDTVFDGAALTADTVAWELSVDDISQYPHEVCPIIAGISGEHAFSFWIEPPLLTEYARYTSWAASPTLDNSAVHSVTPIAAYLTSAHVWDAPALQVEAWCVFEQRSSADMAGMRPYVNAVECVIADLELSVIPAEYIFSVQAGFCVVDTLVAPWHAGPAYPVHVSLANLLGGANLGELLAYEVCVNTSESAAIVVPMPGYAVSSGQVEAVLASVDAGVPITDMQAYAAVIECTGYAATGYTVGGQSTPYDVSLLFGRTSLCATSVMAHRAFILDVDSSPAVAMAPSRTDTAHEVRAEYLCLLECKVCRPLPHPEVQSATPSYAPIILEYDYDNTDPSEYAFIM